MIHNPYAVCTFDLLSYQQVVNLLKQYFLFFLKLVKVIPGYPQREKVEGLIGNTDRGREEKEDDGIGSVTQTGGGGGGGGGGIFS